jgi:hypothetical protein
MSPNRPQTYALDPPTADDDSSAQHRKNVVEDDAFIRAMIAAIKAGLERPDRVGIISENNSENITRGTTKNPVKGLKKEDPPY